MDKEELKQKVKDLRCQKEGCCDRDNCNNPLVYSWRILELIDDLEAHKEVTK